MTFNFRCVCIARGWGAKLLGMVGGMEEDGSTGSGFDGYVDDQTEGKEIGAYVYAVFAKYLIWQNFLWHYLYRII